MKLLTISLTCNNKAEAKKIAATLLKKKLIVCASWWQVDSMYRWHGKIESTPEALLVCKTLLPKKSTVVRQIERLHSYKLPVITIETIEVGPAIDRWARQEIK